MGRNYELGMMNDERKTRFLGEMGFGDINPPSTPFIPPFFHPP
jgi:hypothetical protein